MPFCHTDHSINSKHLGKCNRNSKRPSSEEYQPMEKQVNVLIQTKLLLLLGITFMLFGCCHSSRLNQAEALKAFLRVKRRHGTPTTSAFGQEKWVSPSWVGEELSADAGGNMKTDLIADGLPGQPSAVEFKQFAGYVTVDRSHGRSLFYYFVESVSDPAAKPLILWLNGGPGCSSLGAGAMLEIGPFGVKADGKTLYRRQDSWNKVANILFLESPAGVGFSYSNNTDDYNTSGDQMTAKDSYLFLVNWFKRFPQYKKRDFYIAGESYAGFYIPELADVIIQQNKQKQDSSQHINLKGVMIGNGIMNDVTDAKGSIDYLWSHALISDETHQGLTDKCGFGPSDESNEKLRSISGCAYFGELAAKEAGEIDPYNIYAPICSKDLNISSSRPKQMQGSDPCAEDYIHDYLNLPQVQEAMHANMTGLPYPWELCRPLNWVDSPTSVFPMYRRLIQTGLKILLYSGDVDSVVPVTGTRYSIDALNLKVKKAWRPWIDHSGEVGGHRVVYDGLTFATVRGAGHVVPKDQQDRALALFRYFLESK